MVLGEQKEIQEVKNAYAAYEKMDKIALYSIKSLKELHEKLLCFYFYLPQRYTIYQMLNVCLIFTKIIQIFSLSWL